MRYEGRVQGVGFRATVRDIAQRFEVSGQVRNLLDGSVELIAEGESAELQAFCSAITERMSRLIVREEAGWSTITRSSFQGFDIAPTGN